jgi:hypothetical protein
METLLALAPLLVCPLMMLLMGGGIARAVRRGRLLTSARASAARSEGQ